MQRQPEGNTSKGNTVESIFLYAHELHHLQANGTVELWRPMGDQPPEGFRSLEVKRDQLKGSQ